MEESSISFDGYSVVNRFWKHQITRKLAKPFAVPIKIDIVKTLHCNDYEITTKKLQKSITLSYENVYKVQKIKMINQHAKVAVYTFPFSPSSIQYRSCQ